MYRRLWSNFDVALAQFGVGLFHLNLAGLQILGHLVEGIHQGPEFIFGSLGDLEIQISLGDFLRPFGELLDRLGDALGQEKAKPGGRKNDQQGDQRKGGQIAEL